MTVVVAVIVLALVGVLVSRMRRAYRVGRGTAAPELSPGVVVGSVLALVGLVVVVVFFILR